MTITISAFAWVPPFAQGYVKDIRPRWALAEAGLDHDVHLLRQGDADAADYRAWQPFGQVPAYRDERVELFESGAILLHVAELSTALRPSDAQEAARTRAWVFAALSSVEPKVDALILPGVFHAGEDWVAGHRPHAERLIDLRLRSLSGWLDGRDSTGVYRGFDVRQLLSVGTTTLAPGETAVATVVSVAAETGTTGFDSYRQVQRTLAAVRAEPSLWRFGPER